MKKTKFVLPKTTAQANRLASGLLNEATEKEFSLSALIFAQVLPHGKRKDPDITSDIQRVTCNQFSERGIRGLTHNATVQKYRDTWQTLVDAGHVAPVRLGDTAEWPAELEWSDWYPGDARDGTPERHVAKEHVIPTPAAVRKAIKADPEVAEAAQDALVEQAQEEIAAFAEKHGRKPSEPKAEVRAEYVDVGGGVLGEAITALDVEIEKMERADWVKALLRVAKALDRNVAKGVEKFGYTSVPAEIAKIQEIQAILSETAFKFSDGFIADGADVSGEVKG